MEINKEKMRYLVNIELQNVLNDGDTEVDIAEMVWEKYFPDLTHKLTDTEDESHNGVYEHYFHMFRNQLICLLETAMNYCCCHPMSIGSKIHCVGIQNFPLDCVGECEWCDVVEMEAGDED